MTIEYQKAGETLMVALVPDHPDSRQTALDALFEAAVPSLRPVILSQLIEPRP